MVRGRLVDSGPDTIAWRPEVVALDEYGSPVHVPAATAEVFTTQVQRVSSEDETLLGQDVTELYCFQTSRRLHGAHSALTVNGRKATLVRPPLQQGRTRRTFTTRVWFRYLEEG